MWRKNGHLTTGSADGLPPPLNRNVTHCTQHGLLFRLMTPKQQKALFGNTARAIAEATKEINVRHIGNCLKADPAYGKEVAKAIGIPLSEVPK